MRTYALRPEFVLQSDLEDSAVAFVRAMGWRNAAMLADNLRLTIRQCDALRALDSALVADFNAVRQEQIRMEQVPR